MEGGDAYDDNVSSFNANDRIWLLDSICHISNKQKVIHPWDRQQL